MGKFSESKPKSYQEPEFRCENCKHIFRVFDYDEGSRYYCMYKAKRRPLCGSTQMKEGFGSTGKTHESRDRLFGRHMRSWDRWSKNREVDRLGVCDQHRYEEPAKLTAQQIFGNETPRWKR